MLILLIASVVAVLLFLFSRWLIVAVAANDARWLLSLHWVAPSLLTLAALTVYAQLSKPNLSASTAALPHSEVSASHIVMPPSAPPFAAATQAPSPFPPPAAGKNGGDLNTAVKHLAAKMAETPNNGDGWLLLARTYKELAQAGPAADAYAKAAALLPPDAGLLADWVDVKVVANQGHWDAEARTLLQRALALDPKHIKSLQLSGSEAFERADYKQAIGFWKRVVAVAPEMEVKLAEKNIQEATELATKKAK